jgi:hypothetical protein
MPVAINQIVEQDTHTYLNYTLVNQNGSGSTNARIVDNRSTPIILRPCDYNVTIARFGIESTDIPIMIYPTGFVPNTSLQYFVVTLTYAGHDYQVTAVPEVHTNNPSTDVYVYNVQGFLDSLNNAFAAAWALLNIAAPGLVVGPPKYIYNPSTSIISLLVYPGYVTAGVQIWVSTEINNRVSGIYGYFNGYFNTNYHDFRYFVQDFGNNSFTYSSPLGGPAVQYLIFSQESQQLGNMIDLQKIVFISNLPTYPENTGVMYSIGENGGQLSPGASQEKYLLDFEPLVDYTTPLAAQRFQYQPSLYRLVAMTGDQPIVNITLDIFWQDQLGLLHIVELGPSRSLNVKLLFLKKFRAS